ncbi:MAG: hypothetical protein AAGI38_10590, partial [Bacteroidota bacterium]
SYTYGTISFSTTNKSALVQGTELKGQAFVKVDAVDEVATNIATVYVSENRDAIGGGPGGNTGEENQFGGLPYWCWLLIAILILLILVWLAWQVFSEN